MLRPQYTRRPYEIILIGLHNSGKKTIAKQLLKAKDVFYSINTASSIPEKKLTRVDFVLIIVDLTQTHSLPFLEECLKELNGRFMTNKTAIVVTKTDIPQLWQIEIEDVQEKVESYYDTQLFYVNLSNEVEKKRICDQISRLIKINTLQFGLVDPLHVKSLELYDLDQEVHRPSTTEEEIDQNATID